MRRGSAALPSRATSTRSSSWAISSITAKGCRVSRWRRCGCGGQSAEQGSAEAQFSLAQAYLQGTAVPVDVAAAQLWMNKAAALGHPEAKVMAAELARGGVPEITLVARPSGGSRRASPRSTISSEPETPRYVPPLRRGVSPRRLSRPRWRGHRRAPRARGAKSGKAARRSPGGRPARAALRWLPHARRNRHRHSKAAAPVAVAKVAPARDSAGEGRREPGQGGGARGGRLHAGQGAALPSRPTRRADAAVSRLAAQTGTAPATSWAPSQIIRSAT